MDFRLTAEQTALRKEICAWLRQELGPDWTGEDVDIVDTDWQRALAFNRRLAAKGWTAPAWPVRFGGLGWTHVQQLLLTEQLVYHRAPAGGRLFGPSMVGPTLMIYGTPEQQARHLPPILSGDALWCQGFSEPGAGSDLAALQCRAARDAGTPAWGGDDYIVNVEKVWMTNAHHAGWMILLARTDTEAQKNLCSFVFIVVITTAGISLRTLITILFVY